MSILKSLDVDLVDPITQVFQTVPFVVRFADRLATFENVLMISKTDNIHILARETSVKIAANLAKGLKFTEASQLKSDFTISAFEAFQYLVGLKPESDDTKGHFNQLKCITLLAFDNFIAPFNEREQMEEEMPINGFPRSIYDEIIKQKLLVTSEEDVCIACIDLLTNIVKTDNSCSKGKIKSQKWTDFWQTRLEER